MTTPQANHDTVSETGRSRLEALLERFEEAWEQGKRPAIEEHLPAGGPDRQAALVELIHADLEYRLKAGEPVRVEEYLQRFADLGRSPAVALALIPYGSRTQANANCR